MPTIELIPKGAAKRTHFIEKIDAQLLDDDGTPYCFLTEERLLCKRINCEWRSQCCRLIAEWRR
jgi:hypothetical protein